MLHPQKNLHKFLLTTPAEILGEYSTRDILITHAWPDLMTPQKNSTAQYRNRTFLIVIVEIEEENEPEHNLPIANYHHYGDFISICLSIFFGKRFDHLGLMETNGLFCIPSNINFSPTNKPYLSPFNKEPRKDLSIGLNLENVKLIDPLLRQDLNTKEVNILTTAGLFYLRSLQIIEEQPEMAYVDLVTAGEILSNYFDYSDNEIYDTMLKKLFKDIAEYFPKPDKTVNFIKNRLYQIKRKYSITLVNLLNDYFFKQSECTEEYLQLRQDDIERRIKASYDLRSLYIHTGKRFGNWISFLEHIRAEIMTGEPVVDNNDYKKILIQSPTYVGLERIIRFCLLRFIHLNICHIDDNLF